MPKIPDRLYIDLSDRDLYKKIKEQGMFQKGTNKELFLFAMAIGVKNEVSISLKVKENFFLTKDFRPEDEALINAVALWEEDYSIDILPNKERTYQIAEEYAHAGIKLLTDKVESVEFGSFWKQFEKELIVLYQKLSLVEE